MSHGLHDLIALGENRFLAWVPRAAPDGGDRDGLRALPSERARHVLRAGFRQDRDVRTRVFGLYQRFAGSSPSVATGVRDRDLEAALRWAIAALGRPGAHGSSQLRVLERPSDRPQGHFVPVQVPPPAPRQPVVPDKLSHLEFELLDQHRDPHVGVPYRVKFPDGEQREGRSSTAGYAFIGDLRPGQYEVLVPKSEQPFEMDEADFFDIEMVSASGEPMSGLAYVAKLADGSVREGVLDEQGRAHLAPVPPGEIELAFPALEAARGKRARRSVG